jgi:uncharacterized protein
VTDKILILKDLKKILIQQYPDSIENVILFGSQAKGLADKNSDFDILVLLDKKYSGKDENEILDICYEIGLKYDVFIDLHLLSIEELKTIRGKQPIFINAIKSGIYA